MGAVWQKLPESLEIAAEASVTMGCHHAFVKARPSSLGLKVDSGEG